MIGRSLRAVVVDDCDDMRGIVRILLSRAGYEIVGEAADGAAGVHVTRLTAPDVVVLDLDMPVLDGYAALPLLRKAAPDARLVVFSHDVSYQSAERLRDLGADGWVRKGSPLSEVLAVVESTLFASVGW